MYDLQQMALSNGAYETFLRETGHNMTYQEYLKMLGYSNSVVTSILIFIFRIRRPMEMSKSKQKLMQNS